MCRQREKSVVKSSPSSSSGKSSGQGGTSRSNTDKCYCWGQFGHRRPDCSRRDENCSRCGKRRHLSPMCQSESGANANARADEKEPDECQEIQHVWAMSVFNKSDTTSVESGSLLSVIMDSGAEEHVVSLADWRRSGEPLLKPAQVRLRSATTLEFLAVSWCAEGAITKWWS